MPIEALESVDCSGQLVTPRASDAFPIVVVALAGFSGGLSHLPFAEALASRGTPCLALAHFNYGQLPARMERIPVEYVLGAVERLVSRHQFDEAKLIIAGNSRGSELALQSAGESDLFSGVIATSPSSLRHPSPGGKTAAWTSHGVDLPFVESKEVSPPEPVFELHEGKNYLNSLAFSHFAITENPSVAPATIPVEEIAAPVLLLSGKDDHLWPSSFFADQIEERCRQNPLGSIENVQLEGVGHNLPVSEHDPLLRVWNDEAGYGLSFGGSHEHIGVARRMIADRIDGFIKRVLDTNS